MTDEIKREEVKEQRKKYTSREEKYKDTELMREFTQVLKMNAPYVTELIILCVGCARLIQLRGSPYFSYMKNGVYDTAFTTLNKNVCRFTNKPYDFLTLQEMNEILSNLFMARL